MNICKANNRKRTIWLKYLPLFFLAATVLAGCTGSKGLAKRGMQLEDAGMYTDAANFYFNALMRNNNNVEARIGLTNTSRKVLNDKLDTFSRHKAMDEHKDALNAYLDAIGYKERVARLGISHDIAAHYEEDFEYSKSIVLHELYEKGTSLMAEKRFDEAKAVFQEITKIEPGYEDVVTLKGIAKNEPLYQSAMIHFDNRDFRKAYYELDKIYQNDESYRDVAVLREECLNLGKYPVALAPFENASGARDIEKRVYAFFVTALAQIEDPFLRIVERDNMDAILNEQRLSLSGIIDERTATQVGNLLGAKALINATVLSYSSKPGRVQRTAKDGYESYTVRLFNNETQQHYNEVRYKPVKYTEYYNRNEVRMSVQYTAISLESGEVLFSRIVDRTEEDQMYYAAYDGEVNNLLPAGPNGVLTSNRDRSRLQNLIRAPRTLSSVDELNNAAYTAAAETLRQDLIQFMREK